MKRDFCPTGILKARIKNATSNEATRTSHRLPLEPIVDSERDTWIVPIHFQSPARSVTPVVTFIQPVAQRRFNFEDPRWQLPEARLELRVPAEYDPTGKYK